MKFRRRALIAMVFASVAFAIPVSAQETVTLYSRFSRGNEGRSAFDFASREQGPQRGNWDVAYGNLRAGEDFDWFEISASRGSRSVIKDLGKLKWTDYFDIAVIEPLPKLKPGEQRTITVDTSGADGADGAAGADADGLVRPRPPTAAAKPKHDGKPRIDPIFAKAIVGHLYVIHVVNETKDFYVLFRVEALTRGDNCTISWRVVPSPVSDAAKKEK